MNEKADMGHTGAGIGVVADAARHRAKGANHRKHTSRRSMVRDGVTELKWNYSYEAYECVACGCLMEFQLGFQYCPYCGRTVLKGGD